MQLHRQRYLEVRVENGSARVTYGPREFEIASRWGVELACLKVAV
jgi:hypothetical protein